MVILEMESPDWDRSSDTASVDCIDGPTAAVVESTHEVVDLLSKDVLEP